MFALARSNFWKKFILVIVIAPMMFFGGGYLSHVIQGSVATVGDFEISAEELNYELQNLLSYYQRQLPAGAQLPEGLSEQAQQIALQGLLRRYLFRQVAEEKHFEIDDQRLFAHIRSIADYQDENGEFSLEIFEQTIDNVAAYERNLRQNLSPEVWLQELSSSKLQDKEVIDIVLQYQQHARIVDYSLVGIDVDLTTLDISTENIEDFYQQRAQELYVTPEEMVFDYVKVDLEDFAQDFEISDIDKQDALEQLAYQVRQSGRRQIRHILVPDQELAQDIYAQLESLSDSDASTQLLDKFTQLAKEHSIDFASAEDGGDLGYMTLDDVISFSFGDAVFALSEPGLIAPVSGAYGYHVVYVPQIVEEQLPDNEENVEQIDNLARLNVARDSFDQLVERLDQLAFENVGSLNELAEESNFPITQISLAGRVPEANEFPFNDQTVLETGLSDFIFNQRENSSFIQTGENDGVYIRLNRYDPTSQKALAEVKDDIVLRIYLGNQVAALQQAQEWLNASEEEKQQVNEEIRTHTEDQVLKYQELIDNVEWEQRLTVGVAAGDSYPDIIDAEAVGQIFLTDLSNGLPVYGFSAAADGLSVFRINEISFAADNILDTGLDAEQVREAIDNRQATVFEQGYVQDLFRRYNIEIYDENLEYVTGQNAH